MNKDSEFYLSMEAKGASHEIMLQQAARMAGLGYFVFNIDAQIVEICSESHAAIFGRTPQEFIACATGTKGAMPMVHPDDVPILRDAYARVAAGESVEIEYRFTRADGSRGVVHEFVAPERDATGRVIRGLGSSMDVTRAHAEAHKRAEAQRLEALGALTAGVAHDFNNIFAIVMGNAELAEALGPDATGEAHRCLKEISIAADRGGMLTRKLLSFAQRARMAPKVVDLDDAVRVEVSALAQMAPSGIDIVAQPGPSDLRARIDTDGLAMVLDNLLQNACDAVGQSGRITVTTHRVGNTEARRLRSDHALGAGDFAEIRVSDTGHGIAAEHVHRVTEPFFTTKNRAAGSGLGLSMAAGFARQSRGAIEIRSIVGKGTDVRVFLPLSTDAASPPETLAGAKPHRIARHIVLLDDDPLVARQLRLKFEVAGHTVTVTDTIEALFDTLSSVEADIVLLDTVIPALETGERLAQMIKRACPHVAIVLYSGVTDSRPSIRTPDVDAILPNPSSPEDLLRAVDRIARTLSKRAPDRAL